MNDELQSLYIELDEAREKRDDPSLSSTTRYFWGRIAVEIQCQISEILAAEPKS